MTIVAGTVAVTAPVSNMAAGWLDSEMLSKLLAAAYAALDSDRATAKVCVQRAAELLQVCRCEEEFSGPSSRSCRGGLAGWQKKSVAAYIAANIGAKIEVGDLARVARLSLGHFFRVFRESFGEPPLAYVARQRILRAQALMLSSRTPLSQIALDCGMCDQAHFTRRFRRMVGVNPSDWRRQARQRAGNSG